MGRHVLTLRGEWFERIADGSKTAEIRKHDRDYQIGDRLILVNFNYIPDHWKNTNRPRPNVIEATVSHILPASVFPDGLQVGYSMLSLTDVSEPRAWTEEDRR